MIAGTKIALHIGKAGKVTYYGEQKHIDILQGFFAEEIELMEEDFGAIEALIIEKMRSLGRVFFSDWPGGVAMATKAAV